jgi:hypothetical protein
MEESMVKPNGRLVIVILFILMVPIIALSVEVDFISGEVQYSHLKSDWKQLDIGMSLVSGDIVKTGVNSEAVLRDEDNEIYISENSNFTISEKYEQEKKKPTFMLFLGRMKFKLGKSGVSEPDIQTQTVNLTIRGTEFEVGAGFDGSTIVLIEEGTVAVQGKAEELVLEQGEGTEVAFGEEPTEKFEIITRVIEWDDWLASSQEAVQGNETQLLSRILDRFRIVENEIGEYEEIREGSLAEKDRYIALRDRALEEDKQEEAEEYSQKAGTFSKKAFHSLVNIRFLALSSIGLYDMAQRIYSGIEEPTLEQEELFDAIRRVFNGIEAKYIYEGDRARLEEKAKKKKGCLSLI